MPMTREEWINDHRVCQYEGGEVCVDGSTFTGEYNTSDKGMEPICWGSWEDTVKAVRAMPKMTASHIANDLNSHCRRKSHSCTFANMYLPYEFDFLSITRNDMTYEFEIKVSRSDFMSEIKDAEIGVRASTELPPKPVKQEGQSENEWYREYKEWLSDFSEFRRQNGCKSEDKVSKYIAMASKAPPAPNYFHYAVPLSLIEVVEQHAPEFAGILSCDHHHCIRVVRKPKKIHSEPFDQWKKLAIKASFRI